MENKTYQRRKASRMLHITDRSGNPLTNAKVEYRLVNHEFLFGSGAFDSLPATAQGSFGHIDFYQDRINPDQGFYQDRMEKWLKLFNYGTIPFYWGGFEPKEGEPLTQSRMSAARFLKERNVRVKGHPLCWHSICADWLMEYDNATILKKQIERIHREVSAFRGVIDMWDVINEVVIMPVYNRYDNAITRVCKEYGQIPLVKTVFEAAKEANPDAVLLINDFNLSEKYRDLIADLLDAGVPISAIGLQTHQHQGYMGRERLEEVLERYSGFGLPLHFTENTLVSGDIMPKEIVDLNDYQVERWPSTPEGEERQRREWKEMYQILFGHPLVEAVTGWDFADGAWLHAPSGVIREDNSIKPAYLELRRLIHEEWTSSGVLHTDANGMAQLEGYRGDYVLSTAGKQAEFKLEKGEDLPAVTIQLN
jgi:GH35 family endo-1,4-beta-xylanase